MGMRFSHGSARMQEAGYAKTGNKIKFLHILKPGGIVYAEKLYTN